MVGMDAQNVPANEPTMVLNLKGKSPSLQRSLVIHEFGHALGLEHEHQRSDFWEVVGKYLDLDKMMTDLDQDLTQDSKSETAGFEANWQKKISDSEEDVSQSTYDPDSIMHYK